MEPISLAVLVATGLVAGWEVVKFRRMEQGDREAHWQGWTAAVKRLGMELVFEPGSRQKLFGLVARSGPLELRLERFRETRQAGTRLVWSGFAQGSPPLSVVRRGVPMAIAQVITGKSVELGDPGFEAVFAVRGDALYALCVLDAATRDRLAYLLSNRIATQEGATRQLISAGFLSGELNVVVPSHRWPSASEVAHQMEQVLPPLLELARRLVEPEDKAARLGANLEVGENAVGVRLNTLRLLLRDFPDHEATLATLERLHDDSDPEIRLEVEIARGKGDEGALLDWLEHSFERVATIAARALGRVGTARAVPALSQQAARGDRELTRAATQAIAEIQARLDGAERGQLSLAGGEVGALSLAKGHEGGRLSLASVEPEPS